MIYQSTLFPEIVAEAKRDLKRHDTHRLYNDIREQYKKLSETKKNGVKLYSQEYILAELSRRFYKSPKTIENIVFYRV